MNSYNDNEHGPNVIFNPCPTDSRWQGWVALFEELWLPLDWRNTVTDDYLPYQFYDSLQAIFSSIASMLADREMLVSIGVAKADASVDGALMLNITTEACSRITSILFSWYFARLFHVDCKRYRFLADLFNDAALILQTFSSSVTIPGLKMLVIITAGCMRALCGVCAGSAKASLTNHFAKIDSAVPDINAKEGSQETVVYLIGLAIGSVLVRQLQARATIWGMLITLIIMHLYANYRAVRSVCMTTFNPQRLAIVLTNTESALSPAQTAKVEGIILESATLGLSASRRPIQGDVIGCMMIDDSSVCFEKDSPSTDRILAIISFLRPSLKLSDFARRLTEAGWNLDKEALGFDVITFERRKKMQ